MPLVEFIGRSVWGARYAAGSGARPVPTSEAWLHHTVTAQLPVDATLEQEYAEMRRVEAIGQARFGAGFSYNLALFPSGRAYVGCGVRRVGTHTGGRNTRALGVVLVGDYSKHPVSAELELSLVELLRFAHAEGWTDRPAFDGGHRDLKATGCPGDHAYRLIPALNARAGQAPAPAPAPPVAPQQKAGPRMAALLKAADRSHVYCTDGVVKWHVPTPEVLADLRRSGVCGDGAVTTVAQATLDSLQDRT